MSAATTARRASAGPLDERAVLDTLPSVWEDPGVAAASAQLERVHERRTAAVARRETLLEQLRRFRASDAESLDELLDPAAPDRGLAGLRDEELAVRAEVERMDRALPLAEAERDAAIRAASEAVAPRVKRVRDALAAEMARTTIEASALLARVVRFEQAVGAMGYATGWILGGVPSGPLGLWGRAGEPTSGFRQWLGTLVELGILPAEDLPPVDLD